MALHRHTGQRAVRRIILDEHPPQLDKCPQGRKACDFGPSPQMVQHPNAPCEHSPSSSFAAALRGDSDDEADEEDDEDAIDTSSSSSSLYLADDDDDPPVCCSCMD